MKTPYYVIVFDKNTKHGSILFPRFPTYSPPESNNVRNFTTTEPFVSDHNDSMGLYCYKGFRISPK